MTDQKQKDLRKRSETMRGSWQDALSEYTDDDRRAALYELRTYQHELEQQNEELQRVQEELMDVRDQYIDLYDFAPVGYITLNENNLIVETNLTAADLLGVERRTLLGQPITRYIFRNDQDVFYHHSRELNAASGRQGCELRLRRKDNGWFWAKLESVSKVNQGDNASRIRVTLQDITEAKRLEAELIKAKKLEATALLAGGIAHDFNNLLAVILGSIDLAQLKSSFDKPIETELQNARDACLNASELTKKFLTFSPGGAPLKQLSSVRSLLETASLVLAGSNVNFESSFSDDVRDVEVDISQIGQAIGNVITNAREAMPEGGTVRVQAENVDAATVEHLGIQSESARKYVKVEISDQGCGISEDILPLVFDPYFSSKNMGQQKGLGLGLAIAYSILKKHGGAIEIGSIRGKGTTVSIYLPASDKRMAPPVVEASRPLAFQKKILVMDDEELLRDLTRHQLENFGYEVETARDGEEAIQLYLQAKRAGVPFGVVLLDLTIKGGMGGKDTLRQLKKLDPEVRALVASGYSYDPVMANCREYGFLGALHKPYQMSDLEKLLGELIVAPKNA